MWLYCRQALIFWLNNFDYFTVWCLLLLCHLKRKLFKSTIMPVEVLISIVKDWYEWFVCGLVHLLSNDPFRRTGLMLCSIIGCLVNSAQNQLGLTTAGKNATFPGNMVQNFPSVLPNFLPFLIFLNFIDQNFHPSSKISLQIAKFPSKWQNFPGMRFPNSPLFPAMPNTNLAQN